MHDVRILTVITVTSRISMERWPSQMAYVRMNRIAVARCYELGLTA